jgi:hypothetical protein
MLPQRLLRGINHQWPVTHPCYAIQHKGYASNMIQMRMSQKHMVYLTHLIQTEIANTGSGINQHIMIEQHRSSAQIAAYATATSEYS